MPASPDAAFGWLAGSGETGEEDGGEEGAVCGDPGPGGQGRQEPAGHQGPQDWTLQLLPASR